MYFGHLKKKYIYIHKYYPCFVHAPGLVFEIVYFGYYY